MEGRIQENKKDKLQNQDRQLRGDQELIDFQKSTKRHLAIQQVRVSLGLSHMVSAVIAQGAALLTVVKMGAVLASKREFVLHIVRRINGIMTYAGSKTFGSFSFGH